MTHQPQSERNVDHLPWQTLLTRHVIASTDGINRVTYDTFDDSSKALLSQYITALSETKPSQLNRNEQLAYWVNLYNAQTIQVVLDHPDKDSILSMGPFLAFGPWDEPYLEVEGKPVTLNDIEHRILRPIWRDHRLHYVLNCASIGCPNLSRSAYTATNMAMQLAQAEQTFLQHPRAVAFIDTNTLQLTSLFDWYQTDFADNEEQLLDYVAQQRPDLAQRIATLAQSKKPKIKYVYDWSLNAASNR
ncbi:MAG: DUF547 domain-containing protein [Proteobacteria bacterium]|nr:DUF547 domain-containing protein [Pseudomonadota bacterium]